VARVTGPPLAQRRRRPGRQQPQGEGPAGGPEAESGSGLAPTFHGSADPSEFPGPGRSPGPEPPPGGSAGRAHPINIDTRGETFVRQGGVGRRATAPATAGRPGRAHAPSRKARTGIVDRGNTIMPAPTPRQAPRARRPVRGRSRVPASGLSVVGLLPDSLPTRVAEPSPRLVRAKVSVVLVKNAAPAVLAGGQPLGPEIEPQGRGDPTLRPRDGPPAS